ncbi:sugar kinase [Streptomyces hainanensis]|uniref:Sugar kinase n=1 Tax=Streptomyces hainanensis TaxID=402648 RepID=A0A4R4TKP9_9ACTN|nr:sugar kinase [Streptomyces hainanensis]TDC78538.1 sugar kinase [Streptomyces hainanensis]
MNAPFAPPVPAAPSEGPGGPEALCLGETMAQVTPDLGGRLDRSSPQLLRAGGAESNVAMLLAALGHRAAWCGRLGADPLGDLVLGEVAAAGVDTTLVARDGRRPTGVYFKAPGPKGTSVHYYRRGSAASAMDVGLAGELAAARPRILHLSGITPALSPGCRELVEHLVRDRPVPGALVSFDVNHRAPLWDPAAGRDPAAELLALARASDVVFVGLDEAAGLWGVATAEEVRGLIGGPACLVVKDGAEEAVCFDGDRVVREPAPRVEVVEPVGAGDAFAAGWLSGLLRGLDHGRRLRLGHLVAGAVLGSVGDQAGLPGPAEIDARLDASPEAWRAGVPGPRPVITSTSRES